MKSAFTFTAGNAALCSAEEGIVERINQLLHASAQRHGISLKPSSRIELRISMVDGRPVRRAAPAGQDPVAIPLADSVA